MGPSTDTIRPYGLKFRTRAVTDSDGSYSVSGLPPGTLSVVAIRRGVRIPVQRVQAVGGGWYEADFVLPWLETQSGDSGASEHKYPNPAVRTGPRCSVQTVSSNARGTGSGPGWYWL